MDERIKQWLIDLELYIQKNWVAPKDAIPSEDPADIVEKGSGKSRSENSGTGKKLRKS